MHKNWYKKSPTTKHLRIAPIKPKTVILRILTINRKNKAGVEAKSDQLGNSLR